MRRSGSRVGARWVATWSGCGCVPCLALAYFPPFASGSMNNFFFGFHFSFEKECADGISGCCCYRIDRPIAVGGMWYYYSYSTSLQVLSNILSLERKGYFQI
jgi:hypothetical protein